MIRPVHPKIKALLQISETARVKEEAAEAAKRLLDLATSYPSLAEELLEFGFVVDDPSGNKPRFLRWTTGGIRHATEPEKQMWDLLFPAESSQEEAP